MSTIGSATSVLNPVGAARTAIQIALPMGMGRQTMTDVSLEAAVQRVANLLYTRSRTEVPPDVRDMGGGLFNVLV